MSKAEKREARAGQRLSIVRWVTGCASAGAIIIGIDTGTARPLVVGGIGLAILGWSTYRQPR